MGEKLVPVRHSSQKADEPPGLMSKAYFEKYGKDKGYREVKGDEAEAAVAAAEGTEPEAPAARRGGR